MATPELNLDDLTAVKLLGKGAMGTVFLVINKETARSPFALKVVDKSNFHTKFDPDRRARWEISVLSRLRHPFLPRLIGTLETPDLLAWAVPYCPGGDLNVLRYRQTDRVFSPTVIRFYAAEILCALQHLHRLGIVYRDLKPENVLIQQSGHVTLTDFDLSRMLTHRPTTQGAGKQPPKPAVFPRHRRNLTRLIFVVSDKGLKKVKSARVSPVTRRRTSSFTAGDRSHSFVGTEEYVSPEVVRGDGHEFAVDWWSLGILLYEMMYGKTPFLGKNRKETFHNVVSKSPQFIGNQSDLTDLILKLLEKDPVKRLGYNGGADEVKHHHFFSGLKWDLLTEVLRPPFITPTEDKDNLSNQNNIPKGGISIIEYFKPQSVPSSPSTLCPEDESLKDF